jgi:Na+-transporting NADH:ubiquinone oxidoreductase subunit NqrE
MAMPRPLTRALLLWAFVAFVVWNGFFDAVIRQAEYAYLGRRAMNELGAGPEVTLDVAMADARVLAARSATMWAVFVFGAGAGVSWYLYRAATRRRRGATETQSHADKATETQRHRGSATEPQSHRED